MITKITKSIFAALCLLQIPLEFATDFLCFGMTYQMPTTSRQITHSAARPTPSRGWHCSPRGHLTHCSTHHCHLERSDCFSDTQQLKQPACNRSATAGGLKQSHRAAPNHFDLPAEARMPASCPARPRSAPRCPSACAGLAPAPSAQQLPRQPGFGFCLRLLGA